MIRFSANLGFLWAELSLPDAIQAAAAASFNAVECHWPYGIPADDVKSALEATSLPMLGLNTQRGNTAKGDNGVAAIAGREAEAREYIDQAFEYAAAIGCQNVHVMAGFTDQEPEAENIFQTNLRYACSKGRDSDINVLIEPLNHHDAPGYHLSTLDAALATLESVAEDNLKIMFDCYHLQIMQGDLTRRLRANMSSIGHIQIAAVPDRGEPDQGELHYPNLIETIYEHGWEGYIGAEYKPRNGTEAGLQWMQAYTR